MCRCVCVWKKYRDIKSGRKRKYLGVVFHLRVLIHYYCINKKPFHFSVYNSSTYYVNIIIVYVCLIVICILVLLSIYFIFMYIWLAFYEWNNMFVWYNGWMNDRLYLFMQSCVNELPFRVVPIKILAQWTHWMYIYLKTT